MILVESAKSPGIRRFWVAHPPKIGFNLTRTFHELWRLPVRDRSQLAPKFPAPKKRPYGRGSVSLERGHYVANYKSLETGRQVRKWFLTDKDAQEHLDLWYADKLEYRAAQSGTVRSMVVIGGAGGPGEDL